MQITTTTTILLLAASAAAASPRKPVHGRPTNPNPNFRANTWISFCTDTNFHGECNKVNVMRNQCLNLGSPWAANSESVRVHGDARCTLFAADDCSSSHGAIDVGFEGLSNMASKRRSWKGPFGDKTRLIGNWANTVESFRCWFTT